jgi:methionine--tRNA ligase beta chain
MSESISFEDFKKVDLRIAKVKTAELVEGSEKLLKLTIDLGGEERQVVSGISKSYEPEALIGKSIAVVANLEPRVLMGLESQAMLLAASGEDGPVLLIPDEEVSSGTEIR